MNRSSLGAEARLHFLALAGERLGAALDYAETLAQVAQLAVPVLGDMCLVDVIEDGVLRRLACTHVRPEKVALLEELRDRYPPAPDSPQPAARAIRDKAPELLSVVDPEVVAAHVTSSDHANLILAIGIRSHIAVPMIARDAVFGAISIGITDSDRRYDSSDVALAMDLARRAALAIDNARLFRSMREELAERRRAEAALRLSEARARAVIDQSPLSTQIFDMSGATMRVNRAWEELWGLTLEQVRDYNVLHDPQLEARGVAPYLARAFAGEAVEIPAIRYDPNETIPDRTRHSEPIRWVRAFAYPVKDDDGQLREVVLVHDDVTRDVLAQDKIKLGEERLRIALTGARMNIWDWDLVNDRVRCSENAVDFWGIDVGTAADFLRVIHPADLPRVQQVGQDSIESDKPYEVEYRLVSPARSTRWVQSRGHVVRNERGEAIRIVGITIDITERKAAENASRVLARAGEMLGASLDVEVTLRDLAAVVVPHVADWFTVDLVDDDGNLERVAVYHTDPTKIALAEELFARFPPRRTDPYGAWHVILTGHSEWAEEIRDEMLLAVTHDEEHLRIVRALAVSSYISVPLRVRDSVIGAITMVLDGGKRYTERDLDLVEELGRRVAVAVENGRLYQRLREQDRRKDEFLATLAHELRNPLAPLRSGLDLMQRAQGSSADGPTVAMMQRQVAHMVRLIDDLLDVSRITRGKLDLDRVPLVVDAVIDAAYELSEPRLVASGVRAEIVRAGEPLQILGDRTRLAQALGNLLNNAAKYTPRGGQVTVRIAREGDEVVIRVTDTGVGIAKDMLSRVFEMFAQVEGPGRQVEGGLGIGLTLARRLVELHGGRLWAESDGLGRGSTFIMQLPLDRGLITTESSAVTARAVPRVRRVLVVDDNEDASELIAALLALDGHVVRRAASAEEALLVLTDFVPDIGLLDIGLPGMSGYELAARLREDARLARTRLVAITGWAQATDRERSRNAGFDVHLTKPVALEALRQVLSELP